MSIQTYPFKRANAMIRTVAFTLVILTSRFALAESELRLWIIQGKTVEASYIGTSGESSVFRTLDKTTWRFPKSSISEDDVRFIEAYKQRKSVRTSDQLDRDRERRERRRAKDKQRLQDRIRVAAFYNARGNQIRARNAVRSQMIASRAMVNPGFNLLYSQIQMQNWRRPIYFNRRYSYVGPRGGTYYLSSRGNNVYE
jgi:hypothetical protein